MNVPMISVIVPVYQVESCLAECLDSIFRQEFRDLEVICVYDDSSDRSLEILQEYARRYDCIRIHHGRGVNLSSARNDGLRLAAGKYILFMDSDDAYPADALLRIAKKMEESGTDILVFNAEVFPVSPRPPMFYSNYLTTQDVTYASFRPEALFRELGARPFIWRNCYKRSFLQQHGLLFHEDLFVGEDQAFQMEAFPLAKRIDFTSEKLYRYRWFREGSLQYRYDRDPVQKLRGHIQIVSAVAKNWSEANLMASMGTEFAAWAIDLIYSEAVHVGADEDRTCIAEAAALLQQVIPHGTVLTKYTARQLNALRSDRFPKQDGILQKYFGKLTHILHIHGFRRSLILIKTLFSDKLGANKHDR